MSDDNSEYVWMKVWRDVKVKKQPSKGPLLNGWLISLMKLFSCHSSTNSNSRRKHGQGSQFTTAPIMERILRANDREFNEQFQYAVSIYLMYFT